MKKHNTGIILILIISLIFVAAYKRFEANNPDTIKSSESTTVAPTDYQQINEKKDLELVNGEEKITFNVEVAKKSEELRIGLMNRNTLDADKGMLFVFPYETPQSFWMQNTLIPLDIIFFNSSGNFVSASSNAAPCVGRGDDCPTFPSNGAAKYALETNAGSIKADLLNSKLIIANLSSFQ